MDKHSSGAQATAQLRGHYMAQLRKKRLLNMILLIVFIGLMAAGFRTAEERNAGGFLDGVRNIFDFPADVVGEAISRAHLLKAAAS